jgi:hypothetical protein
MGALSAGMVSYNCDLSGSGKGKRSRAQRRRKIVDEIRSLRPSLARLEAVQCRGTEDQQAEKAKVDEGKVDGLLE